MSFQNLHVIWSTTFIFLEDLPQQHKAILFLYCQKMPCPEGNSRPQGQYWRENNQEITAAATNLKLYGNQGERKDRLEYVA